MSAADRKRRGVGSYPSFIVGFDDEPEPPSNHTSPKSPTNLKYARSPGELKGRKDPALSRGISFSEELETEDFCCWE
jgi:hypothetical protein